MIIIILVSRGQIVLKEKQATRDNRTIDCIDSAVTGYGVYTIYDRTPAIASLAWPEPKDLKINENIGLATLD